MDAIQCFWLRFRRRGDGGSRGGGGGGGRGWQRCGGNGRVFHHISPCFRCRLRLHGGKFDGRSGVRKFGCFDGRGGRKWSVKLELVHVIDENGRRLGGSLVSEDGRRRWRRWPFCGHEVSISAAGRLVVLVGR